MAGGWRSHYRPEIFVIWILTSNSHTWWGGETQRCEATSEGGEATSDFKYFWVPSSNSQPYSMRWRNPIWRRDDRGWRSHFRTEIFVICIWKTYHKQRIGIYFRLTWEPTLFKFLVSKIFNITIHFIASCFRFKSIICLFSRVVHIIYKAWLVQYYVSRSVYPETIVLFAFL